MVYKAEQFWNPCQPFRYIIFPTSLLNFFIILDIQYVCCEIHLQVWYLELRTPLRIWQEVYFPHIVGKL